MKTKNIATLAVFVLLVVGIGAKESNPVVRVVSVREVQTVAPSDFLSSPRTPRRAHKPNSC